MKLVINCIFIDNYFTAATICFKEGVKETDTFLHFNSNKKIFICIAIYFIVCMQLSTNWLPIGK